MPQVYFNSQQAEVRYDERSGMSTIIDIDYQRPAVISTPIAVRSVNAGRNKKTHAVTKNLQYTLCLHRRIQNWWSVVHSPIDCPQCLEMLSRVDEPT